MYCLTYMEVESLSKEGEEVVEEEEQNQKVGKKQPFLVHEFEDGDLARYYLVPTLIHKMGVGVEVAVVESLPLDLEGGKGVVEEMQSVLEIL